MQLSHTIAHTTYVHFFLKKVGNCHMRQIQKIFKRRPVTIISCNDKEPWVLLTHLWQRGKWNLLWLLLFAVIPPPKSSSPQLSQIFFSSPFERGFFAIRGYGNSLARSRVGRQFQISRERKKGFFRPRIRRFPEYVIFRKKKPFFRLSKNYFLRVM